MITRFLFRLFQVVHIHATMVQLPAFKPFGKTIAEALGLVTAAEGVKDVYLQKHMLRESGRAGLRVATQAGHRAAIQIYAAIKSAYGEDRRSLHRIVRIPKASATPSQTLTRMEATSKLWADLPNPPGQSGPLVLGALDRAAFDVLIADLKAKMTACVDCAKQFEKAEADLHENDAANRRFITGALRQGRAQFAAGTAGRELIDGIPTEANTPLPGQAVILEAESNEPGFVHILAEAPHATSYIFLHKGPEDTGFSEVQQGAAPSYDPVNIEPGQHQYKVVPRNSRGNGPASAVVTIEVAAQAAA